MPDQFKLKKHFSFVRASYSSLQPSNNLSVQVTEPPQVTLQDQKTVVNNGSLDDLLNDLQQPQEHTEIQTIPQHPQTWQELQQKMSKQRQFKKVYGQGYQLIVKMGFKANRGLGVRQDGILEPVPQIFKNKFTGGFQDQENDQPVKKKLSLSAKNSKLRKQLLRQTDFKDSIQYDQELNDLVQKIQNGENQLLLVDHQIQSIEEQLLKSQSYVRQIIQLYEEVGKASLINGSRLLLRAEKLGLSQYLVDLVLGLAQNQSWKLSPRSYPPTPQLKEMVKLMALCNSILDEQSSDRICEIVLGQFKRSLAKGCDLAFVNNIVQVFAVSPRLVHKFVKSQLLPSILNVSETQARLLSVLIKQLQLELPPQLTTRVKVYFFQVQLGRPDLVALGVQILGQNFIVNRVVYPKLLSLMRALNIFKSGQNKERLSLLQHYCRRISKIHFFNLVNSGILPRLQSAAGQVKAKLGLTETIGWLDKWSLVLRQLCDGEADWLVDWFQSLKQQIKTQ